MNYIEKNIVSTYSIMFEGLSSISKIELIEKLKLSLKKEKSTSENDFYSSFGAFGSNKNPEEIINEIKLSRKFKNKEIKL
jgi:hypothetical protein